MEYNQAGFDGQRPDPVSRYYSLGNGYRTYSPQLRRFTTQDSMSPFGAGGINPYMYCAGDPVNQADPSGHFSLGQGIGMGLSFVAGIALSILTEGAAMPVALTLMATVAGDAAIGAGAELTTQAIDGQRINWNQVGHAAGISAVATLVGYGLGVASKLKGSSNQPFGGLMIRGNPGRTTPREIINIEPEQYAWLSNQTGKIQASGLFQCTAVGITYNKQRALFHLYRSNWNGSVLTSIGDMLNDIPQGNAAAHLEMIYRDIIKVQPDDLKIKIMSGIDSTLTPKRFIESNDTIQKLFEYAGEKKFKVYKGTYLGISKSGKFDTGSEVRKIEPSNFLPKELRWLWRLSS